jgi:hypothetical protein
MTRIPKFKTLDEAAEFWESHDFEDYVDDTEQVVIAVKLPRRKKALTVPVDAKMYRQLEALAAQRGVPVADLVWSWVRERALAESTAP